MPKPAVRVRIVQHSFRTTVFPRAGRSLVPLSAENRAAAGVAAGDDIDVHIEADASRREVAVPSDLADALARDRQARDFFDTLADTHRK